MGSPEPVEHSGKSAAFQLAGGVTASSTVPDSKTRRNGPVENRRSSRAVADWENSEQFCVRTLYAESPQVPKGEMRVRRLSAIP
jgi:hypothetical protein